MRFSFGTRAHANQLKGQSLADFLLTDANAFSTQASTVRKHQPYARHLLGLRMPFDAVVGVSRMNIKDSSTTFSSSFTSILDRHMMP